MTGAMDVIDVKNLVKRYKKADRNAVDGISFSVKEGEFFAFLGPNGAGKTTTISILTTTLAKTSGDVKIAGFDIDKQANKIRQNVGIIFQNPSLDQNLTAEENMRFHAVLYGLYGFKPLYALMPDSYKKRVGELAEMVGIGTDMHKPIKTFSGGMKRKLEIIRSLMHKPKVLFLDEPTIGLDPLSRKNLWAYLMGIRKSEKITIFLTTHYLEEAEKADQICIVNHGKIITKGTPAKIKSELVEEFILVDAKDRNKLINELDKLKFKYDTGKPIKVYLREKTAQEVIKSIGTPLSALQIHTPSLSDAYIEIIERGNNEQAKP